MSHKSGVIGELGCLRKYGKNIKRKKLLKIFPVSNVRNFCLGKAVALSTVKLRRLPRDMAGKEECVFRVSVSFVAASPNSGSKKAWWTYHGAQRTLLVRTAV